MCRWGALLKERQELLRNAPLRKFSRSKMIRSIDKSRILSPLKPKSRNLKCYNRIKNDKSQKWQVKRGRNWNLQKSFDLFTSDFIGCDKPCLLGSNIKRKSIYFCFRIRLYCFLWWHILWTIKTYFHLFYGNFPNILHFIRSPYHSFSSPNWNYHYWHS